jgi:PAS domain S-box-containing protein
MSGSGKSVGEGETAARRIAADPAFAALQASGAPIVAAAGDPPRVVHLNESAAAVFGVDARALTERLFADGQPCAGRLRELVESVRHGAAPRLERLRVAFGDEMRTVTVLCRTLRGADGPSCFVVAALGVRGEAPPRSEATETAPSPGGEETVATADEGRAVEAPAPSEPPREGAAATESPPVVEAPVETTATDDGVNALRERLASRHGARLPRFLWKTDAQDRFVDVTQVLADVVGDDPADLIGRDVAEISRAFGLGDALVRAVASRKTWSGVEVEWPLEYAGERTPAVLCGFPVFDAEKRFAGYQGSGQIHLSRAFIRADAEAVKIGGQSQHAEPASPAVPAGNVVPLRPPTSVARVADLDGAEPESPGDDAPAGGAEALTPAEKSAFDEIAQTLAVGAARALQEHLGRAVETEGAGAPHLAPGPARDDIANLLERAPVGVLAARGAEALYANRTLLDCLGYPDLDALNADGGLARLFFGCAPRDLAGRGDAAAVEAQAQDGKAVDLDAHMQTVEWAGAPATMVTLRRRRPPPRAATDPAAKAQEFRALEEKLARADAEAQELRAELRAAFEASGEPAAILDAQGRIGAVNAAFAKLFCGEPAEFVGADPAAAIAEDGDSRRFADILARVRAGAGVETAPLSIRARRGAARPVEAALARLGPHPERAFLLRLREAPAARGLDRNQETARIAAERASAAKSEFLARVSHEIRTPLNAILGFAEVMMEERFGPIGSERYKDYLRDVHASGAHVLSLVNDLLDLSKIEAGKLDLDFSRVDANAAIAECASLMQPEAARSRVVMRLDLAERLPSLRADARSLKQILLNLMSNAVKFNEPGGQVIVSTAVTDAGAVAIRVKDTGLGMSEDEIATALEPFGQLATSRKASGTGLGLPVTKALIEANHASFIIRSRKGEGTLIEVAFPPPQVLAAE